MKVKAKNVLSEFYLNAWNVNENELLEIELVNAKQFLRPERIDLICKLFYIDSKINNKGVQFARELYTEHIRAFSDGTFTELEKPEKNTIEKYLSCFDELINTCPKTGILSSKSVIPVGDDNNILDGSHRTSIAIFFNLPLPIVRIKNVRVNYNFQFFKEHGLSEFYLDFMAMKYVYYSSSTYIACVWPVAYNEEKLIETETIIKQEASIIYRKELSLNYHGLYHLMIHAYGNGRDVDKWAGSEQDGFIGITENAMKSFLCGKKTVVYLLGNSCLDKIVSMKKRIRNIYNLGNSSIHCTDYDDETMIIAQTVFNKNSIDLLNNGEPFRYSNFVSIIRLLKDLIIENNLIFDNFVLGEHAVYSLYGLCDLDSVEYYEKNSFVIIPEFENKYFMVSTEKSQELLDNIVNNPNFYLYYRGIKYLSFDAIKQIGSKNILKHFFYEKKLLIRKIKRAPLSWRIEIIKTHLKSKNNLFIKLGLKLSRFIRFKILRKQP